MSGIPLPLVANDGERAVGDNSDPRLTNVVVETVQIFGKEAETWVQKRPGLKAYDDLSAATTDTGRGIFEWDGRIYSVIGDELFNDETDIGQINTSTGLVYFDIADSFIDVPTETAGPFLVFHDGANLYAVDDENNINDYNIAGTSGATTVANLPAVMLPGIVVLDQYVFLASNGDTGASTNINEIHNSNVGDISTWSGDFIVGEMRADKGVAIARYYNYIVSFNEKTLEFFYDAANASGTPLNRYQGVLELFGSPAGSGNCVASLDSKLIWVAQTDQGGRFVAMLDGGFQPQRISTHILDEYLEAEGANISDAYGYHIRTAGNNLYILTLPTTAAKTFVFDLDEGIWYLWTSDVSDTETYFTAMGGTSLNGNTILLDEDNGLLYELDPEVYVDNTGSAETIKVEINTRRYDSQTMLNKFSHRLYPVADSPASGTADLLVSWSDDDYKTFVTNRTMDLTKANNFLTRLGFYRRRSYRLQYQSNNPLRIQALVAEESHGYYAR